MNKCEKCGIQVPDGAKFCPKCGSPIVKQADTAEQQTTQQPAQQNTEQPKKKTANGAATFFNKHFWLLFVSTGLIAYLLMEVAGMYVSVVSAGFAVMLGVFSIIFGLGFCAIGVLNKVMSLSASEEDKKKYAVRNNICLAVGIILAVAVLLGCIAIFDIATLVRL